MHWNLCGKYEIIDMPIPADKNISAKNKEDEKLGWNHSQKPPNNLYLSIKFMISYFVITKINIVSDIIICYSTIW